MFNEFKENFKISFLLLFGNKKRFDVLSFSSNFRMKLICLRIFVFICLDKPMPMIL